MPGSTLRPSYSTAQLRAFYEHINLPKAWRVDSLAALRPKDDAATQLALLDKVLQHSLATIPFENLTLHYSQHKTVILDLDVLFGKVVGGGSLAVPGEGDGLDQGDREVRNYRGGYCMENNLLMAGMLRAIGFKVTSVGGRVWEGSWTGWGHMINLVTINGTKYQVDIGFGPAGPSHPLPLPPKQQDKPEAQRHWPSHPNTAPASARLVRRNPGIDAAGIAAEDSPDREVAPEDAEDEALKLWVYEVQPEPGREWKPTYSYVENEFYPRDYAGMSFATSNSKTSWFTQQIVCVRMVLRSEVAGLCRRAREECGMGADGGENGESGALAYEDGGFDGEAGGSGEDEIVGQLVLLGNVKLRVHGKTRILQGEFETEDDRVAALKRWFGIQLTDAERRAITGMSSQVKKGGGISL